MAKEGLQIKLTRKEQLEKIAPMGAIPINEEDRNKWANAATQLNDSLYSGEKVFVVRKNDDGQMVAGRLK